MIETLDPRAVSMSKPASTMPGIDALAFPSDPAPEVNAHVFILATTFGSKAQLAALLQVSPATVEQMDRDRQLFSFVSRSKRYRLYGLYQALPEVAGAPLKAILARFYGAIDARQTWMTEQHFASFFRAPNNMLAWATPLEVLLGHRLYDAPIEQEAAWLYAQDASCRLRAVLGAAHDELMHRRN